jgi:hypothetical protein
VIVSMVSPDQRRQVGTIQRSVGLSARVDEPSVHALASGGERVDGTNRDLPAAKPQQQRRPENRKNQRYQPRNRKAAQRRR